MRNAACLSSRTTRRRNRVVVMSRVQRQKFGEPSDVGVAPSQSGLPSPIKLLGYPIRVFGETMGNRTATDGGVRRWILQDWGAEKAWRSWKTASALKNSGAYKSMRSCISKRAEFQLDDLSPLHLSCAPESRSAYRRHGIQRWVEHWRCGCPHAR